MIENVTNALFICEKVNSEKSIDKLAVKGASKNSAVVYIPNNQIRHGHDTVPQEPEKTFVVL